MAFHMDKVRIKPEPDDMEFDDDDDDMPDPNFACEAVYNADPESTEYGSDLSSSIYSNPGPSNSLLTFKVAQIQ